MQPSTKTDAWAEAREAVKEIDGSPAREVWELFQMGLEMVDVSSQLGFTHEYVATLLVREYVAQLSRGAKYQEVAKVVTKLEPYCWKSAQNLMSPEQLKANARHRQIWQLGEAAEFRIQGLEEQAIAERLDIPEFQITKFLRLSQVLRLRLNGHTLDQIGKDVGLTRERVRKMLDELGITSAYLNERHQAEQDRVAKITQDVIDWVITHPGCTYEEISDEFGLQVERIRTMCNTSTKRLIVEQSGNRTRKGVPTRFPREKILAAMRQAAEVNGGGSKTSTPDTNLTLTGPKYVALLRDGVVDGPSLARILQVFGSWRGACSQAGLACDEPAHDSYVRKWDRGQLLDALGEFVLGHDLTGIEKYDEWARCDASRPSSGTVRLEFGSWSNAKVEALLQLRTRWAQPQEG